MNVKDLTVPEPGPYAAVAILDGDLQNAEYASRREHAARALAAALISGGDMDARHALRSELCRVNLAYYDLTGHVVNQIPDDDRAEMVARALEITKATRTAQNQE